MYKKHLGFSLNILALGLFFPGILLTMFSFNMEMMANLSSSSFTSTLVNKELSIMATVKELWQDQRIIVAMAIFVFSVAIPLLKSLLVAISYFCQSLAWEKRLLAFVSTIGKWSMADVFVVAIFLAVLSTNHAQTQNTEQFSVFGFSLSIDISSQTLSNAGQGFYYFLAYCLVSLLGTHLAHSAVKQRVADSN
ncbi:paraquat-inducible protein A [Paraglaciecola aestuariivivens]